MYACQVPQVKQIIESYEQSVNLRRSFSDNKNEKVNTQNIKKSTLKQTIYSHC